MNCNEILFFVILAVWIQSFTDLCLKTLEIASSQTFVTAVDVINPSRNPLLQKVWSVDIAADREIKVLLHSQQWIPPLNHALKTHTWCIPQPTTRTFQSRYHRYPFYVIITNIAMQTFYCWKTSFFCALDLLNVDIFCLYMYALCVLV